jgi:hypothetical protein
MSIPNSLTPTSMTQRCRCRSTERRSRLSTTHCGHRVARHPADRATDRQVSPGLLPARRRSGVRDVLDQRPWRRGDGLQLCADGPHGLRATGSVGELACQLAATRPLQTSARTDVPSPNAGSGPVRRRGQLDQALLHRQRDRVSAVTCAEFAIGVDDVRPDRVKGDR